MKVYCTAALTSLSDSISYITFLFSEWHITRTSESLIDIMMTKSKEKVTETDVVHCGISDHSLVYGIYKIEKEKKSYSLF